jgi:geranylgeranyl reductase family protein
VTAAGDADVLVVGAGPAGVAASLTLVASGRDVLLLDKATFPRDKCCGDGLTTGALRLLDELGFDPARVPRWRVAHDVRLRSPSGREVRLDLPAGAGQFAAVAPRIDLDAALLAHARARGVRVRERTAFARLVRNDDRVEIESDDGESFTARWLVAADGMWSPVRKAAGAADDCYLGEWHAFRQYARGVTGPARDGLLVWFEPDLLPGYAWSFPLPDGRANLGFGILRGGRHAVGDMRELWSELLARPHVRAALGPDAELEDRHSAWPIPARVTDTRLAAGRVLFVGDAARTADTLTGEGIGQALLSGMLAGGAIVRRGRTRTGLVHGGEARAVRAAYSRAMRREFFADHRMSHLLGRVLRSPRAARGAIRVAGLTDWTRRNFVRWMFEDEPRAAAFTPRRWHRRFLRRPGAFAGVRD